MTIYRSYILFYCKAICKRLLLEESKGVTHQKCHHQHLLPRKQRGTCYISCFTKHFPIPWSGCSTGTWCDWAHCSMWHHILSHRCRNALLEQQWALRDRTQNGTAGSALIICRLKSWVCKHHFLQIDL